MTDLEEIAQLREQIASMEVENSRLAEMCQWIVKAQVRSGKSGDEAKVNDYLEAQTDRLELLQNSSFTMAYTDLMDKYQRGIMNTQPEQTEDRESFYLKSRVLQELLLGITNQQKAIDTRKILQDSREQKLQAVD